MKLEVKSFGGVAPRQNPRLLPDTGAQIALNCEAVGGAARPLRAPTKVTDPVFVLGGASLATAKTIYRFGQDETGVTSSWMAWPNAVDVCRSQIAGDSVEWTYYTEDGSYPKMFNTVSKGTLDNHWRLGIPAPYGDPDDASQPSQRLLLDGDFTGPVLYLGEADWKKFTTTEGIAIYFTEHNTSVDNQRERVTISLTEVTLAHIAAQINAASFVDAVTAYADEKAQSLVIVAGLYYSRYFMNLSWGGYIEFPMEQMPTQAVSGAWAGSQYDQAGDTGYMPEGAIASLTRGWRLLQKEYGFRIQGIGVTNNMIYPVNLTFDGANSSVDALVTHFNSLPPMYLGAGYVKAVKVNNRLCFFNFLGALSSPAGFRYALTYRVRDNGGVLSAQAASEANEERVYAWTWICDTATLPGMSDSSLVLESPPSPPSDPVRVSSTGSTVTVTFPADTTAFVPSQGGTNTENVKVTGKRLYRSTAGEYLLVTELPLATLSYVDAFPAEALGEALPTLEDVPPPADLRGLINLTNGMMAGFTGRDLYFCRPYLPYAWPVGYSQTLDYPIVGLGRIDTTLVALTKGVPYFVQGSSPDLMTVVKSDIEQACVAKRSIVSLGGMVLFASPDGLIVLTTGGSRNLTEALFRREQWQTLLGSTPETTFHAYGHDNQYIAFHAKVTETYSGDVSVDYYGFIYDLASGQLTRHNRSWQKAGFVDLRNDQLFTLNSAGLWIWGAGDFLPATWRSKKFSLPQIGGFACAQVEADNGYTNLKATLYRDGTKVVTELTDDALTTVTAARVDPRYPFRLEAKQGRDWEVQLDWTQSAATATEVYNVVIAQSMSELAGA